VKKSIRVIGVTALAVLLAGCYSLKPAAGVTPDLGSKVVFDVNDVGRVALGPSMGAEIAQIEGRLLERTSEDYLISVSTVRFLRGGVQPWTGERVRLKPEFLGSTYERKFSRSRTIAATAITVGGFAALVASGTFGGFLGMGGDPDPKPTPEGLIRRP
jgi:hypothetical protein